MNIYFEGELTVISGNDLIKCAKEEVERGVYADLPEMLITDINKKVVRNGSECIIGLLLENTSKMCGEKTIEINGIVIYFDDYTIIQNDNDFNLFLEYKGNTASFVNSNDIEKIGHGTAIQKHNFKNFFENKNDEYKNRIFELFEECCEEI